MSTRPFVSVIVVCGGGCRTPRRWHWRQLQHCMPVKQKSWGIVLLPPLSSSRPCSSGPAASPSSASVPTSMPACQITRWALFACRRLYFEFFGVKLLHACRCDETSLQSHGCSGYGANQCSQRPTYLTDISAFRKLAVVVPAPTSAGWTTFVSPLFPAVYTRVLALASIGSN